MAKTYDELLRELEDKKKNYDQYANESAYLKNAEQNAKVAQEAAVIGADTAYQQQKATYGTKAEALQNMGLTGGGYSDYLEAQAYAQKRADTSAANAQYATTMRNARYQDYMTWKAEQDKIDSDIKTAEENYRTDYATLMGMVKDGTLNETEIAGFAGKYGVSGDDLNALNTAATQYKTDKATAGYAQLMKDISDYGYTPTQVEAIANTYGLDETQITALKRQAIINNPNGISSSDVGNDEEVRKAYNEQESALISPTMFEVEGLSYAEAKKYYDEIQGDKNLDLKYKDEVKTYFESTYGDPKDPRTRIASEATVNGFKTGEDKNLTIDIGDDNYKAQTKGKVDGSTKKRLDARFGGEVSDNNLVFEDGHLYVYHGGEWYELEVRGRETDKQKASWTALLNRLG